MNTNTEKTFDNFITGKSNETAYKTCKKIVSNLKKIDSNYNPLFIFGGTGLGKTHLLNALCNEINKKYSYLKITYVNGEKFSHEYISSLLSKCTDEFYKKYKSNTDVLVIDDIQFVSRKNSIQNVVYDIIKALLDNNKQVVLASNINLCTIADINKSLNSIFVSIPVIEITPPEYDIRYKIVKNTTEKFNLSVPEEVIEFVAGKITSNMFQLHGAVNNICGYCNFNNSKPTVKLAEKIIKDLKE